ncbi:hypothetical protein Nepgr_026746 [Nepenthes gracilis]|uniref:Uncharacterized protein n=1 Tax=Nepenthes gracilis TaxID=150966 RepID=A0AAD3T7Q7_NEPGR|nr:hypothetical protein Nepgr_026746 [Nepenthes gracilis]
MRDRNRKGKSGEREHKKKEREVKDNASQPKSLYSLFTNKCSKEDKSFTEREEMVVKEYSSEMEEFLRHLYDEGYFRDANFLPSNKFDISSFENGYACNFLKFAAEMFGKDKQEIAKWLSGSDLKTVALFGCPSLARRNVFAAKRLRTFFHISENTVCGKCNLADSCKFKNQSVWKGDTGSLNLSSIMRLLIIYATEAVSPPLVLSDDVKACIGRLIKDAIKLSKTVR